MNTSSFLLNLASLHRALASPGLLDKFNELLPLINNYRSDPVESNKLALDTKIIEIQNIINDVVETLSSTPESSVFLEETNLGDALDVFIYQDLGPLIYKDLYQATSVLTNIIESIRKYLETAIIMISNFTELGIEPAELDVPILSMEMPDKDRAYTADELTAILDKLSKIVYFYARTSDNPAEANPPIIHSISKSSPLTVEITWTVDFPSVLMLLTLTLAWVVKKREDSIKYKETETLILNNLPEASHADMKKQLKKHHDNIFDEKSVNQHVDELAESIDQTSGKTIKPEEVAFLKKGVEALLALTEEGAQLGTHLPLNQKESTEHPELARNNVFIYKKTREIEVKRKQLETNGSLKISAKKQEEE